MINILIIPVNQQTRMSNAKYWLFRNSKPAEKLCFCAWYNLFNISALTKMQKVQKSVFLIPGIQDDKPGKTSQKNRRLYSIFKPAYSYFSASADNRERIFITFEQNQ